MSLFHMFLDLKSAGYSSPQDKSPSNIDGASSASSPSRQRKSVIRKGGAKINSMFSKWNKKVRNNFISQFV